MLKIVKNCGLFLFVIGVLCFCSLAEANESEHINSLELPDYVDNRTEIFIEDLYGLMVNNAIPPKLAALGIKKQEIDLKAFWYNFDPVLSGSLSLSYSDQRSLQGRTRNNTIGANVRWERPSVSGDAVWGEHGVGWNEVDSTFTTHSWSPYVSLGYTKQLGEGGSERVNRLGLKALENTKEYLDFAYQDTIKSQKNTLLLSYLSAAFQLDSISVRHKNLDYARDLLNRNIARYKVGLGTKADLLAAESQVKQQEAMLANDVKSLDDSLGQIELLVGADGLATKVKPVSLAKIIESFEITQPVEKLIEMANANDRELASQQNSLKNLIINREQLNDRLKPSHSVSLSATRSGANDELTESYATMNDTKYSVVYNFRQPIGERDAKAQIEKNQIDIESILLSVDQRRQDIANNCRNIVRSIEQIKTQMQYENASVASNTENYNAQRMRNRQGMATTLDELGGLQALLGAELSRLGTMLQLNQKWLNLQRLIGTENYKIQNYEF